MPGKLPLFCLFWLLIHTASDQQRLSQWKTEISFRALKHATISLSIVDETRQPTYGYQYHAPDQERTPDRRFHINEVGIGMRLANSLHR
ncbi:hypothetical protein [Spirosoma flavus]